MALISVTNLRKRFNLEAGFFARFGRFVYAVNGVSFTIGQNETYGLVGESGCGKTTTARLLVRMYESDEGTISFQDTIDVGSLKGSSLKKYREQVKYVFQDPARSLNPRMSIYKVLTAGYRHSTRWPGEKQAREEAEAILEEVGLGAADLERRPAEFSGGQRQRISIARGLLPQPDLLICDEVVSALDVSIQGQILNLLIDLRQRHNLSFLFIAHDLKVASYFCDRIGVMYRGELMEEAPAADLFRNCLHPYTKLLFSSAGSLNSNPTGPTTAREPLRLSGELQTPVTELTGCAFAERCPLAEERCRREHPEMRETGWMGQKVRCFIL
ncbi:oligopeptide transport ATP-binding protein AppF [Treponema primitia ZAS-2]|uniref:Oligopeptide transport ATP-binding protein AppF n=1 Tax=Treponema primitia (strain ATCC BAA-887 / DSM 12427 / ZAS-2) TaxID=545694 RepID=F5YPG9_TREPZ|nr:ABC transporter ATP-binding protein [Treponema primitia]AEF83643.1 oligopeptide transport ATP-binding protein AppF [Treponema primitia ZAS-2]